MNPAIPAKLAKRSKRNAYNVFEAFDWSEPIPGDSWWMGPELLSVHGTAAALGLDEPVLKALSKWETVNLFSVFTQGEADLIQAVVERVHQPFLEPCFEYLVHFIDEENKHMWFFSAFCLRRAGKIYPQKKIKTNASPSGPVEDFLAFMRIVLFEEMGDRYNVAVMNDLRVPRPIREIHRIHHQDEVGHLAIGREICLELYGRACREADSAQVSSAVAYLRKYLAWTLQNVHNPAIYKDAGITDPYPTRNRVMSDPARVASESAMAERILSKFAPIFSGPEPA